MGRPPAGPSTVISRAPGTFTCGSASRGHCVRLFKHEGVCNDEFRSPRCRHGRRIAAGWLGIRAVAKYHASDPIFAVRQAARAAYRPFAGVLEGGRR
jgi:hypothetical protein